MSDRFFTPAHESFRKKVRRFVDKEIKPYVAEWEDKGDFPSSVFRRLGELGFLGIRYPKEYGGGGGDFYMGTVLAEELARSGSGSMTMAIGVQTEMTLPTLLRFGTEEQKQRYLVPALRGEKIACLGITEPNAGSDVFAIQTRAIRDGDDWVINGNKIFITNGVRADFIVLVAKTAPAKGYTGFSLFLVDKSTPGFTVHRKLEKVGLKASDTTELFFTDCRVPHDNLLGEEGKGFYQIMWELESERLLAAIGGHACSSYNLNLAITYLKERARDNRPLENSRFISHRIAEAATQVEAIRQFNYLLAERFVKGEKGVNKDIAIAKYAIAQISCLTSELALEAFGNDGLLMKYPAQRAFFDSRLGRIGAGTDEVMKGIIAKDLGV